MAKRKKYETNDNGTFTRSALGQMARDRAKTKRGYTVLRDDAIGESDDEAMQQYMDYVEERDHVNGWDKLSYAQANYMKGIASSQGDPSFDMENYRPNVPDHRLENNRVHEDMSPTMGNYSPEEDKLTGYDRFMGYKDKYTQRKEDEETARKQAKKDAKYSAYKNEKANALENMNQEQYEALERYNDRVDFWKARGGAMPTEDRVVEEKQAAIDAGIPEDKVEKYAQYVKEKDNERETNKRNEWVKDRLTDDTELNSGVSTALKGMGRLGAGFLANQNPFLGATANYGLDQLKDKTLTRGDVANMVAAPLDVLASPVVGMAATETANKLNYADKRAHVDTNSRAYALQNLSNTIEQTQKENIADAVNNQNWSDTSKKVVTMAAQGAYDLGMTTSKAALSMAIGQVAGMGVAEGVKDTKAAAKIIKKVANIITLPSYGTSSYAQTLKEGYERGLSEGEAQATAFVAGCAEMLTEVFSLDMALDAMNKGGRKLLKEKIVDALAGAAVEGSEEFFNDIINGFADTIINGDKSEYNVEVEELMKQGLSKEDAQKEATINFFKNGAKDFAMGMASGLILQGGASLLGSANAMDEVRMLHQEGNYREFADGIDIDPNSYADENQVKVAEKTKELYEKLADKAERGETIKNSEQQSAYELLEETMGNAQQNLSTETQNLENEQNTTINAVEVARALREAETPQDLVNAEREAKAAGLDAGQVAKEVGRVSQQKSFDIEEVRQLEAVPTAEEAKKLGYEGKEAPENLDLAGKKAYGEGKVEAMKAEAKETTVTEPLRESTATYNGKTIKINDVLEDGYYATNEGKVPATKVKFNNKGAEEVYQDGLTYKGDTRKAYYDYFPGNITPKVYNYCFDSVYTAGSMGKDFREFTQRHTSIVNTLGFDAVARIYDIAQKENTANRKAQGKGKATHSAGAVVDERENTPESNDTLLNIAEGFAMKVPTPIHIGAKNLPHGALGMFKDNTIYIADNTGKEVEKISHEIGEFCKMYNAEGYAEVEQAFIDWNTATDKRETRFDKTNKAYFNRYQSAYEADHRTITPGEATDEVFNDSLGKIIFSDEGKDFVEWAYDTKGVTEANNLLDKVMQFLNDLFDHIKEFISGQTFKELGENITSEATNKELENLRRSVLNMIDEASRKYREEAYNNTKSETQTDNVGVAASYALHINNETFDITFDEIDDVLSEDEIAVFYEKIGEIKQGKDAQFVKTKFGEYVFAINDKLVYTDGKYRKPEISKVAKIKVKDKENEDTYRSKVRDLIYEYEKPKYDAIRYGDYIRALEHLARKTVGRQFSIAVGYGQNRFANAVNAMERKTIKSATTNRNSTNIKNRAGSSTKSSSTVKPSFALGTSPEETKDLVAIHNVWESKLSETLSLGGFAMPSIAIVKKDMGHNNFGNISVVFGKNTIDPELNKNNKVYTADAYTPTKPQIDYKINREIAWNISDRLTKLAKNVKVYSKNTVNFDPDNLETSLNNGRNGLTGVKGLVEKYKDDVEMKQLYLAENNNELKEIPVTKQEEKLSEGDVMKSEYLLEKLGDLLDGVDSISRDFYLTNKDRFDKAREDMFKEVYGFNAREAANVFDNERLLDRVSDLRKAIKFRDNGDTIVTEKEDYSAAQDEINKRTDQNEYEKWLNELFAGLEEKKGVYNGKDYVTNNGRRSFEALHWEYNLENVVKAMKMQEQTGVGFGGGSIYGASQTEYNSIDEIKASKDRLSKEDEETFHNKQMEFVRRFSELSNALADHEAGSTGAGEIMCEAVARYKTKSGIANYIRKEGQGWTTYSDYIVDDLMELVEDIRNMPTAYFEAKPQRAVGLDEIKNVILPTDASQEIKDQLSERNIPFTEYEAGNEEDRIAKLNSLDNDVFFSLEVDTEGNELSEGQKEYFKDSKVVDENGALKVMYHGSPNEFTVFDRKKAKGSGTFGRGFYFSESDSHAGQYGNTLKVYLNVTTPLTDNNTITKEQLRNFIQALADDEDYGIENYGYGATVDSVLDEVWGGHDFKMIIDLDTSCVGDTVAALKLFNEVNGTDFDGIISDTEVVTFESNQAKNVDNLDPTEDPDIRYSLDLPNYSEEVDDLIFGEDLSPMLKQGAELLKDQEVDRVSVERVAKDIIKQTSSEYNPKKLADNLEKVFAYMQSQGEVSYNDLSNIMVEVARPVVEESRMVNPEEKERYDNFVSYLKGISGVRLTDKQKQEVRNTYGTYKDFRNKFFGKLNISDNGSMTLDQLWSEMVDQSNGVLESDAAEGDMPIKLVETLDALKPSMVTQWNGDNNEAAYDVALRILHNYYDQAGNSKEIQAYKRELREKAKDFRDRVKANYEERLAQVRQSAIDNRERVSDAILKERARVRDIKKEQAEKQEASHQREQIRKTANLLFNMLEKPTDKRHIPDALRTPITQFLASIDFVSPRAKVDSPTTLKWQDMARKLAEDIKEIEETGMLGKNADRQLSYMKEIIDPDLYDKLKELAKETNIKVSSLSPENLKTLNNCMKALKSAVVKSNEGFGSINIEETAKDTISYLSQKKERIDKVTGNDKVNDAIQWVRDIASLRMLDSISYFETLGPGAKKILNGLQDGFKNKVKRVGEEEIWFENMLKDTGVEMSDLNKWQTKKEFKYTFEAPEGEIELSAAQLMELYAHSKREQSRAHYARGGIRSGAPHASSTVVHITPSLFAEMMSKLTDEQKLIADKMQHYLSSTVAGWGNNASKEAYGYSKFNEKYYWPIKTDSNTRAANDGNTSDNVSLYAIKNKGFSKNTEPDAKQPMIIGNAFMTFGNHVAEMATYEGMLIPLQDAMSWYNYSEVVEDPGENGFRFDYGVKQSIERVLGKYGQTWFTKFIKDVNGADTSEKAPSFIGGMVGNAKAAAIGANMSVVVQQPTAIVRAAMEMNPKYLLQAQPSLFRAKKLADKAQENSMLAKWKHWGYFDAYLGKSMTQVTTGTATTKEKVQDFLAVPAQLADDLTWGVLWKAVEYEIADTTDLIKGTEEFDKAVTERFDHIIDRTQVVDTVFNRSDLMRSTSELTKLATAFKMEPGKSYNMLYRAVNSGDKQKMFRAGTVFLLNALVTAMARGAWVALRDDDDEHTYFERWLASVFGYNGEETTAQDIISSDFFGNANPLALFPWVSDAFNALSGYDATRMDVGWIYDTIDAGKEIYKWATGTSNKTPWGVLEKALKAAGETTGIPYYSIYRDFVKVPWNNITNIDYFKDKGFENIQTKQPGTYDKLKKSIVTGNDIETQVQAVLDKGKEKSDIGSTLSSNYKMEYNALSKATDEESKEDFKELDANLRTAFKAAGFEDEEINTKLDMWAYGDGKSTTVYQPLYDTFENGGDVQKEVKKLMDSGKEKSQVASAITSHYKDKLIETRDPNLKSQLIKAYMAAGYTNADAKKKIDKWFEPKKDKKK